MRRNAIILGILIPALASSAFCCISLGASQPADACTRRMTHPLCSHGEPETLSVASPWCGRRIESPQAACAVRGFIQLQFVEIRTCENPAPPQLVGVFSPRVITSPTKTSVGSPETDRGPPADS